ncbi:amino acid ABC transporter permease [bacterium]|nr:MAG: amino acid ABC transporter permease [bacterium]
MTHLYLYAFDWSVVLKASGQLFSAVGLTAEIVIPSLIASLLLGLVVAVCRMSHVPGLSMLAYAYIQVCRGLSLYVYILWIYFGVGLAFGIDLSPWAAAVVSLTLLNSAYMAEIYRAALEAIDPGQTEAARSLGMDSFATFVNVLLPQGFRIALPALVNQFVDLLKDSSIVAAIGASDLMYTTIRLVGYYNRPFELYTMTAFIYIGLAVVLSRFAKRLETHMRRHLVV